jgi:hypothetical protein
VLHILGDIFILTFPAANSSFLSINICFGDIPQAGILMGQAGISAPDLANSNMRALAARHGPVAYFLFARFALSAFFVKISGNQAEYIKRLLLYNLETAWAEKFMWY